MPLVSVGYSNFIYYDNFGNFLLHVEAKTERPSATWTPISHPIEGMESPFTTSMFVLSIRKTQPGAGDKVFNTEVIRDGMLNSLKTGARVKEKVS